MTRVAKLVDRASHWLARIAMALVVAMAAGFVISLLAQVTYRYALNAPLAWSEELATLLFVWATLLAAATASRTNETLRLTFVEDALSPRRASLLRGLQHLLTGLFGAILVWYGWRLAQLVWSDRSAAMGYPSWLLYLAAPVTGVLLIIHSLARLIQPEKADLEGSA